MSTKDIGYALYTCTFLVFLIEIHQKHALSDLSEGVMSFCLKMGSTLQTRKNIFQKKKDIKIYN